MKKQYGVSGMTCAACSAAVEKAVSKVEGVEKVAVNLLDNSMTVECNASVKAEDIVSAVEKAGYRAFSKNSGTVAAQQSSPTENPQNQMKHRFLLSLVFLIPLMWVSMGHMMGLPLPELLSGTQGAIPFALTQLLLTLPILYINRNYFQTGFKTLFHGSPNMDSLIAIGSLAAVVYGVFALYQIGWAMGIGDMETVHRYHMDLYFESAGTILTLITFGKFLESRAKGKTGAAIQALLNLAPKTALVKRQGQEREIPVEEVVVGDYVVVKPGMRIAVDGVVVEGSSSVDESAITGESIPVHKQQGDKVIAATINKNGSFVLCAEKVGADTTLSQIVELVKQAGAGKAPIAKLADKVSGIFVPIVMGIAALTFVVWMLLGQGLEFALSRSIAVLVISCPCALGLATPVAIMVGTGRGAKEGVLFHDAEALENAHHIDTLVLDKTGTITQGKPFVTDLALLEHVAEQDFWRAAAALENPSEHPLSEAIVEYAKSLQISVESAQNFTAISGKGLQALWQEQIWFAGNQRLMEEKGVDISQGKLFADRFSQQGKTPLYFAKEGILQAVVAVADVVKPTSKQAIAQFAAMGIDVWMITGDNTRTAHAIGQQLNIPNVKAEVLPQDKEEIVRQLQQQGKKVAMVGDGINDAPALVRADVGIAIGAGTDVAIESADVVLMKSDLWDVVTTIRLSKSVITNIKENLFWAFFYNSIGIPLAAGVLWFGFHLALNPMFGAAAMSLSSVCVVSNALRLNWFKAPKKQEDVSIQQQEKHLVSVEVLPKIEGQTSIQPADFGHSVVLSVEGMMCNHCVGRVEKALMGCEGVQGVEVSLENHSATVRLQQETTPVQPLLDALKEAGYPAQVQL